MILEYAHKMTKKEVDDFYSFIRSKQEAKIKLAEQTLEEFGVKLINAYHEIAFELDQKYGEQKKYIEFARECFREKKCECGLKLKIFINPNNGREFWGCPDYRNENKIHRAWNYEPQNKTPIDIFQTWLTKILYRLDLKDKLHTKYLLAFYEENNLPDLQFEYTGISSKELINRLTNINSSQKAFELRQVEFLRNQWPNVFYQFPVKYKYAHCPEKSCFIDILCSNDDTICIYECKTNKYNIDDKQMKLYVDVIKFINQSLKINKKLTIDYLTED